jgi:uncharacterized protein YrrD
VTLYPNDLRTGVDVYSRDGEKVGNLHRVVMRRGDFSVSHIVVDIGFLRSDRKVWEGGFGLDYDRIVPIGQVRQADDDRIDLLLTVEHFMAAPEYTQEAFEEPHDLTPNEFDIPDVANRAQGLSGLIGGANTAWVVERLNKPLDSVDIKEGIDVWRREPHTKLGDVERVLIDPATGHMQAVVIRRGFFLTRDIILPVRYIAEIVDDVSIRVDISDAELAELREYEE